MTGLYPDVPVFRTHWLPVGDGHQMRVQHAGAPDGLPVLLLHGGPGSGQSPLLRLAFDPARFHVIAPDQRGAGGSLPAGHTPHNTLPHLLADLRLLRETLQIERWLVVGGSWGATLALAHAVDLPEATNGLLLRASFLARAADIHDFFDPHGRPDDAPWAALASAAGTEDPAQMAVGLSAALAHTDGSTATSTGNSTDTNTHTARQAGAALAWWAWEQALSGHAQPTAPLSHPAGEALAALVQRYRVQAHYLAQGCGMDPPLLHRARRAPPVPTLLLHADDDGICPPAGARALHAALPQAQLRWAPGAGHSPAHPAMAALQRQALDHWGSHQTWPADTDWAPAP